MIIDEHLIFQCITSILHFQGQTELSYTEKFCLHEKFRIKGNQITVWRSKSSVEWNQAYLIAKQANKIAIKRNHNNLIEVLLSFLTPSHWENLWLKISSYWLKCRLFRINYIFRHSFVSHSSFISSNQYQKQSSRINLRNN